ncbi:N-6 DNA methylase [Candidatus Poseidoniales archaeon]|jgi:adenine-specific DNA-methyltransferase|nr:N-6 DNA methylase [Candidatus Poseidoniales archaeon]
MGGEVGDIQRLVVEEKLRYSKSIFPQTTLDTEYYNEKLSIHLAESIATSLNQNSIDSKLEEHSREPFTLGKIIELIHTIQITPFQNTSSTNFTFRKNVGIYYTPKPIVDYIVKKTLRRWLEGVKALESEDINAAIEGWWNLRLIDPACGTGSFLVVAANELVREYVLFAKRNNKSIPDVNEYKKRLFTNILHGVDVDAIAVRLCSANLRFHLGLDTTMTSRIVCGDSLTAPLFRTSQFKQLEDWPEPILFAEQFPDVFEGPIVGFDILIMNPPYGKLRAESGKGIRRNKERDILEKKRYERLRKHIRESKMYPCCKGVLNWYKLFIERALHLLNKNGSMGFIVPSTLLCDDSTKDLRRALLEHELSHLLEIPEKNNLFENVTQSYSIGVLNKDKRSQKTDFRFGVKSMKDAENKQKGVILREITDVTEKSFSIPLTTSHGLSIFLKMHQHQTLSKINNIINKRGEIDLTNFKSVLSNSPGDGKTRLLRGNDVEFCKISPINVEKPSLINQQKAIQMLGGSEKVKHLSMKRIVCQQIANQNNADRLIFAPIDENMFCGNSLNYICWVGDDAEIWNSVLLGLLNSTLLDWRFKITSTNNHVNNYEIDDLPLPLNESDDPKLSSELHEIAKITDQLKVCHTAGLARLRDSLDKMVFSLYDLTKEDIKFVLEQMGATRESTQFILGVKTNE